MTLSVASRVRRLWLVLVGFTAFWFLTFALYPERFFMVGVNHYGPWFLDSYAILASNDALSLGRDAYLPNPLDPFHRPHVYTHWWLHLRDFGLTRAQNVWVGLILAAGFFATAFGFLRPREPRELVWYLMLLCSSAVALAVNRANNDLVIFMLLAPVVPALRSTRRWVRLLLPTLLIALATALKFYPATAALLLLAPSDRAARDTRLRLIGALLVLGLVAVDLVPDLARFSSLAPKADGLTTFGAVNLPETLGLAGRGTTLVALGFAVTVGVAFLRSPVFADWIVAPEDRGKWLSFVLGATLLAGCFFTGTNFAYRWIFAIWMAPWLWSLPRDRRAPVAVRRLAAGTGALLLAVIWADPLVSAMLHAVHKQIGPVMVLRVAEGFFLIEQPFVWALFACLTGFLAHFLTQGLKGLGSVNLPARQP